MNKNTATLVNRGALKVGNQYIVKTPIGEVLCKLLSESPIHLQIVQGMLQSQRDKSKNWRVGDTIGDIIGAIYYEPVS